ncbi:MAG: nucleotidyl transferase AbiEii/AbiGii toxin family protein [Candidatus Omnitrophota bacterium]|nr:nucleotidyl transferase AbiEii/AbiGii toxin family protein [Candidatus Omnitrophota bacterium]
MTKKTAYIQGEQKRITELVTKKFKDYYLTGGTALAFYFEHRFSEDLDFFSQKYKKSDPDKIMKFIKEETGFDYRLDAMQDDPSLIPMKVYFMELKNNHVLKIDFVKDYVANMNLIRNGLHSIDDIYLRKLYAAIGMRGKELDTGRKIATGRQSVKDLFDIYYLSSKHKLLCDAFFEFFSYDQAERLDAWYRGFDKTETKLGLMDLVPGIDTGKIFKHLDEQIIRKIPDKLK